MMKIYNLILLILVFFISGLHSSFAQVPSEIFISEYIEGSANNKAIELYNGTNSSVDLGAGDYVIQMFFNGSTTAGLTIALKGNIASKSTFILAHSAATFSNSAQQVGSGNWFNGDDVVILKKGGAAGTTLDAVGQLGNDPGTQWGVGLTSTADNTLRKKESSCTGDYTPTDPFDPSLFWDGFALDDFSGLGTHTATCSATTPFLTGIPDSLIFNTTYGKPSPTKSFALHAGNLREEVVITAPSLFEVSLKPELEFSHSVAIPVNAINDSSITIYIRYNPTHIGNEEGKVTLKSGNIGVSFPVTGSTFSTSTTKIYDIQGIGNSSLLDGTVVNTEGLVTASFQNPGQLNGFYIQDTTGDGNNATSDAIFVFNITFSVKDGDYVKLSGEVDEYFGLTEIKSVSALSIISSHNSALVPAVVKLPMDSINGYEKYEGMLLKFPQTLTATEVYTLGRYGEVLLSADGRLINPTNYIDPNDSDAANNTSSGNSNAEAIQTAQELNNRRSILLDDGSTIQNPSIIPYLDPSDTTLRVGSSLDNLTGILDYSFNTYRIQPTVAPQFHYAVRPLVPFVGNSNIRVASFNVLNYFNGDGKGGGFPTPRGANTAEEFSRQRAKTISAITQLKADIIGLIEVENDGDGPNSAIANLVEGLNNNGLEKYAYISDARGTNGNAGTDAIKVAIIYKPLAVTPVGYSKSDTSIINNRPPLAQTFISNKTKEKFTFIVNHFKSKGCEGAIGPDADQKDGQSCFNERRKLQAVALLNFISKLQAVSGDGDIISVGDYNSYGEEDPLDILKAGGMVSRLYNEYSFVFQGQSGSLDHVFFTPTIVDHISGVAKWHINADEPVFKDYNKEFNPPYAYSAGPYRSSDHDPVLVGLNLPKGNNNAALIRFTAFKKGYYTWYIHAEDKKQLWILADGLCSTKLKLTTIKNLKTGKGKCYATDSILLDSGTYSIISKSIIRNKVGIAWKIPSGEVEELVPSENMHDCLVSSDAWRSEAFEILDDISDITISPVPVQEVLNIGLIAEQTGDVDITIVNTMSVDQLKTTTFVDAGFNNLSVAISLLPSGVYFLKVETGTRTHTKKIIIGN